MQGYDKDHKLNGECSGEEEWYMLQA